MVSDFSEFGNCSEPCGGGTQERKRQVVIVGTEDKLCPNLTETRSCNLQSCQTNYSTPEPIYISDNTDLGVGPLTGWVVVKAEHEPELTGFNIHFGFDGVPDQDPVATMAPGDRAIRVSNVPPNSATRTRQVFVVAVFDDGAHDKLGVAPAVDGSSVAASSIADTIQENISVYIVMLVVGLLLLLVGMYLCYAYRPKSAKSPPESKKQPKTTKVLVTACMSDS